MKAIFRLTIFMFVTLVLSSGVVSATTWRWVDSDSNVGWFYDTDSIAFGMKTDIWGRNIGIDTSRIVFWAKIVFTPEGAMQVASTERNPSLHNLDHVIALRTLSLPDKTYIIHNDTYYTANGAIIASNDYPRKEIIIPDSWGELLYKDIIAYATVNKDQLTMHTWGIPW